MDKITFDFIAVEEFARRFPAAMVPNNELPVESGDGIVRLLEAEQEDHYYIFLVREGANARIWSRNLRALFDGLPNPIIAVYAIATARARQEVRENLQCHFRDVTERENEGPSDNGPPEGGMGVPLPRRPLPPTRSEGAKQQPPDRSI